MFHPGQTSTACSRASGQSDKGGQVDRGQETGPFLHLKIKYDSFTLEKRSSEAQASSSVRSLQRGKGVSRRLL